MCEEFDVLGLQCEYFATSKLNILHRLSPIPQNQEYENHVLSSATNRKVASAWLNHSAAAARLPAGVVGAPDVPPVPVPPGKTVLFGHFPFCCTVGPTHPLMHMVRLALSGLRMTLNSRSCMVVGLPAFVSVIHCPVVRSTN